MVQKGPRGSRTKFSFEHESGGNSGGWITMTVMLGLAIVMLVYSMLHPEQVSTLLQIMKAALR